MLSSFRLRWTKNLLLSRAFYPRLKKEVRNPLNFYLALALKFLPGLYKGPIELELADGKRIAVRSFMTLYVVKEIFIDRVYDLPEEYGPVNTIIDVGANTGLFVTRAKQLWPKATILAFEPEPENFSQLQTTIAKNAFAGVTASTDAVSDACGEASLSRHPHNIGGHSMYHNNSSDVVVVKTDTIRNVLDRLPPGTRCDYLKIDCEGCEKAIFESLDAETASRIRTIVYEVEPRLYAVDTMNEKLKTLGYVVKRQNDLMIAHRAGA